MTDTATAPQATYELLDPAKITVRNIRAARPGERFIGSIRDHGVMQPIGVLRAPGGDLVLRFGGRRLQACIEIGCQVPAIVVDGIAGTDEAEIDRIFRQIDENDHREALTAADRATAVQALFDLGADEALVSRKTGLGKAEIAAARRVARSETARALAAQYPLDLTQSAEVAEFEGDKDVVKSLTEAAKQGSGTFAHAVQRARDARADREAIAAHTDKLAKRGIKVSTAGQHHENRLYNWAGEDGQQLTEKAHRDCPGNVVTLYVYGGKVSESWYCTDPKAHGHKRHRLSGGAEQTPEERQQVIAGNKAWRSAEKVRRDWMRGLLARPKAPDGGLQFTLEAFARADNSLLRAMQYGPESRHVLARELLGLPKGEGSGWSREPEVYTAMTKASPARSQVIALAIVLGAREAQTGVHSWRTPTTDTADYLETLARWGYELSEIERELVAAVRKKEAEQAAAVKADEAVAQRESAAAAQREESN